MEEIFTKVIEDKDLIKFNSNLTREIISAEAHGGTIANICYSRTEELYSALIIIRM